MVMFKTPVIILDDDLKAFKGSSGLNEFKVLDCPFSIRVDSQEIEDIVGGRIVLTSKPEFFEGRQVKWDFDLIVLPASDVDVSKFSDIIGQWAKEYDPIEKRTCWRLDIDEDGRMQFKILAFSRCFTMTCPVRFNGEERVTECHMTVDFVVTSSGNQVDGVCDGDIRWGDEHLYWELPDEEQNRINAIALAEAEKIKNGTP